MRLPALIATRHVRGRDKEWRGNRKDFNVVSITPPAAEASEIRNSPEDRCTRPNELSLWSEIIPWYIAPV
jgi:hypothetical protein